MKLSVALLSANLAAITAKVPCSAPPELGKGEWTCPNNNVWNHGETCRISGDGCNGSVKCWKGNWRGKTSRFCPKDCEGTPKPLAFGGQFECEDGTCVLNVDEGFKCSSSVKCNTSKGRWTGKAKCIFADYSSDKARKNPPARPDGSWTCVKKCVFTCDDGSYGGSGKVTKKGWVYDANWNICSGKTTPVPTTTEAQTTPTTVQTTAPATTETTTEATTEATTQATTVTTTKATEKHCICPNGTPIAGYYVWGWAGQRCEKNGSTKCDSCDPGFQLKSHKYKGYQLCVRCPQPSFEIPAPVSVLFEQTGSSKIYSNNSIGSTEIHESLEVEFKLTVGVDALGSGSRNILHIGNKDSSRQPHISFLPNSLRLRFSWNQYTFIIHRTTFDTREELEIGKTYTIKTRTVKVAREGFFNLFINGNMVGGTELPNSKKLGHKGPNDLAAPGEKVKIWASSPFSYERYMHPPTPYGWIDDNKDFGSISELKITKLGPYGYKY